MSVDYAPAIWRPADDHNYSPASWRKEHEIDRIIIHKIEGSASGAVAEFQRYNSQKSCQYVVASDGTVYQCVRDRDVAWQAGYWPWNQRSIGIEHAGYTAEDDITDKEYEASARLLAHLSTRHGIPLDRTLIKGHYQVPGCDFSGGGFGCHTDPGVFWRWRYYLGLARRYREDA